MPFIRLLSVTAVDIAGYALIISYILAIVMMATWVRAFWVSITAGNGNNAALMLFFGSITNLLIALLGGLVFELFTDGQSLLIARLWTLTSVILFIASAWLADRKSTDDES